MTPQEVDHTLAEFDAEEQWDREVAAMAAALPDELEDEEPKLNQ